MRKPAHELLVEEVEKYLTKITKNNEQSKPQMIDTVCLSQTLGILQRVKIPRDKMPWVKKSIEEMAIKYAGRVNNLENLLKIVSHNLIPTDEETIEEIAQAAEDRRSFLDKELWLAVRSLNANDLKEAARKSQLVITALRAAIGCYIGEDATILEEIAKGNFNEHVALR